MSRFIWGSATASYQIEGAVKADGRGESVWDVFCRIPGKVANNDTGDVACDHYNRYREDIALMHDLGLDAYRFSIAWPRVLPQGTGAINQKGLDFYSRLVDALLEKNITPWMTLFHWDLPQALQERGGWGNRDILGWFEDYTRVMADALGDRVKNVMVINEPSTYAYHGHFDGAHAPGLQSKDLLFKAVHHQNMAIVQSYKLLKSMNSAWNVGSAYTLFPARPASNSAADVKAAAYMDALCNGAYFDPLFKGQYPDLIEKDIAHAVKDGDLKTLHTTLDFIGLQHYAPWYYQASDANELGIAGAPCPHARKTGMDWAVDPEAFYECLARFKDMYNNPVTYMTENGAAYPDVVSPDGHVHDAARVQHYKDYIDAMFKVMDEGMDIRGYFAWSLLDNFEWGYGYAQRFGLIHVDYTTQKRTPKDTYYWYRDFIRTQKETVPSLTSRACTAP